MVRDVPDEGGRMGRTGRTGRKGMQLSIYLVDQILDWIRRLIYNHVVEQIVHDLVESVIPVIAGDEGVGPTGARVFGSVRQAERERESESSPHRELVYDGMRDTLAVLVASLSV